MKQYIGTRDLQISDWGPFSKSYYGISHIADHQKGLRFDFSVMPGYYRTKLIIPSVLYDSGVHPFEGSSDYSYYSFRYEMEWKDQLYCDVSYFDYDEDVKVVRCEFVNNTQHYQNASLNFVANLVPPKVSLTDQNTLVYAYPILPKDAVFIDALNYQNLTFCTKRPQDNLNFGGLFRGEERANRFVNGSALGKGFGNESGDRAHYQFELSDDLENAYFIVRYKADHANIFQLKGAFCQNIVLPKSEEISYSKFEVGTLNKGTHEFDLIANGPGDILIDGFVLVSKKQLEQVGFEEKNWDLIPQIIEMENAAVIKYQQLNHCYGIKWSHNHFLLRQYVTDQIEPLLKRTANGLSNKIYNENGENHYTNAYLYPLYLEPNTKKVTYGFITNGEIEAITEKMKNLSFVEIELENLYQKKRLNKIELNSTKAGEEYQFGIDLMSATLQSNIVFPIYVQGQNIRHNTPGKWWDCLYTWDSGFIGLGLSCFSKDRAVETLNAYMTESDNMHAKFIHFGSPVPVQIYLMLEIYNRYHDEPLLKFFYPRLKQYYDFLAGKTGSSTTNIFHTNLLQTWDYFYNSGGWDDYPPQVYIHEKKLTKTVTPVCTTSHIIRCAKILKEFAITLHEFEDILELEKDITKFSDALLKNAWDVESGYFGYVIHDEFGFKKEILKSEKKENFNMGLDGIFPLVSGITSEEQNKILLNKLKSEEHIWTNIGLSTVDQKASYFKDDGYWNGAVWMPQQWFFYKTMLDLGEGEFARKIAMTALNLWKEETNLTYNCYEHFLVKSGRGAGWHAFSGLSSPVVNWFTYYFVKGSFNGGFELLIHKTSFNEDYTSFHADVKICGTKGRDVCAIVVLTETKEYQFLYNGKPIKSKLIFDGTYELKLPVNSYGKIESLEC